MTRFTIRVGVQLIGLSYDTQPPRKDVLRNIAEAGWNMRESYVPNWGGHRMGFRPTWRVT